MADEFRKKISKKLNMKEVNVVNWLHNSQITKNQWVKAEREKIEENNTKECTFKPIINKRSYEAEAKYSLKLRTNDKFNDLYQKAKRDKVKKKIENNKQDVESIIRKDECTFMPKESLSKQNSKCSNSSVCDANSNINNQDSHIGSNPEITSSYKPFDTEDIEYVNKKIEEIKTSNNDFELNYENHDYSPDDDQSNSKNSLASPVRINNVLNIQNRITSETPKTEELEEEMRDQVLDYQNPIFNNCKPAETQEFEAQEDEQDEEQDDNPLLFVDVNLGPDKAERIVVYEGDTAEDLAYRFSIRHNLNDIMKEKLTQLLEAEISGLDTN